MSAQNQPTDSSHPTVVKSNGRPGSDKDVDSAHHTSFGNLTDVIEKKYRVPGDEIPYWDPMGYTNTGHTGPIDLKKDLYRFWRPVYDEINSMLRDDRRTNLGYAAEKTIEKQIGRSSFSIPIFFTPDVYQTSLEDTPLADLIPRVAVSEDTIKVDEQTDLGNAGSFNSESAVAADKQWPENDDAYLNHTYQIFSYGRQNRVSDFVQLAAQGLRSTRAVTEEAQVAAIRQYEERQFFLGRGGNVLSTGNDPNGFVGLPDIVQNPATQVSDELDGAMNLAKVRESIRYLRRTARSSRENIVHFTDHTTFETLKSDLTDFLRYDSPGDVLDFGFDAVMIDNTPVLETHGLPDTGGNRMFVSVDMASVYAAMLQDVTMHPLARDAPEDRFAVDAYGALVGESQKGIRIRDNLA